MHNLTHRAILIRETRSFCLAHIALFLTCGRKLELRKKKGIKFTSFIFLSICKVQVHICDSHIELQILQDFCSTAYFHGKRGIFFSWSQILHYHIKKQGSKPVFQIHCLFPSWCFAPFHLPEK